MAGSRGSWAVGLLTGLAAVLIGLGARHPVSAQDDQEAVVRVYVCPAGYSDEIADPYADCSFAVAATTGVTNGETFFSDESGTLVLPVNINDAGVFYFVVRIDYDRNREADPFEIDKVATSCYTAEGPVEDVTPAGSLVPFPTASLLVSTDLDIACDFFVDPIWADSPLALLAAGSPEEPVVVLPDTGVGTVGGASGFGLGLAAALLLLLGAAAIARGVRWIHWHRGRVTSLGRPS